MVPLVTRLIILLAIYVKVSKSTILADQPIQVNYIIVAARQRSGSSTLSTVIGGHPCAVTANEIWTDQPSQDSLGGHKFTDLDDKEIRQFPREFLSQVYISLCNQAKDLGQIEASCDKCTIVVKMFDIHSLSATGVKSLIEDEDIAFVVLERNAEQESCSLQLAHEKGDWGTTPAQHKVADFHCTNATKEFVAKHDEWFSFLRVQLLKKGRYFLNVPFDSVASCKLQNVVQSIFAFAGLETPTELTFSDGNIVQLFKKCS